MCITQQLQDNLIESNHTYDRFKINGTINVVYKSKPLECEKGEMNINISEDSKIMSINLKLKPSVKYVENFKVIYSSYSSQINANTYFIFDMKKEELTKISNIKFSSGDFTDYVTKSKGKILILDNYDLVGISD